MAEEILRRALPQAEVFSRGMRADSSYVVPQKVIAFLTARQIAPTAHTSVQLSGGDLEKADWVFCMERAQQEELLDRYAQFTDKIHLLRAFAQGKEKDIEDPISLSGRAFEKAAQQLEEIVLACADKLKKG